MHKPLCVYTYICNEYMYMNIFLSIDACTYTDTHCNCIVGATAWVLSDCVELSSSKNRKPETERETQRRSKLPWGSEFRTCQNLLTKDSWYGGLRCFPKDPLHIWTYPGVQSRQRYAAPSICWLLTGTSSYDPWNGSGRRPVSWPMGVRAKRTSSGCQGKL